jgi:hypothetical protein
MKLSFAALAALLTAGGVPQSALYAQAPQRNPTFRSRSHKSLELRRNLGGTRATIGERWEHCERLRDGEHKLRDRLAFAPRYGEERERLEHRLREVDYERERCRGR